MIGLLMFEKNMHESSTRSSPFTLVFSYVKRKSSKEQMYRDFDQKPWNVNGKSCKAKPCKLLFKESFRQLFMRGGRAKIKKSGKSPKYYYYYYYFLFCTPNIGISNIYTNKPIKFLRIALHPSYHWSWYAIRLYTVPEFYSLYWIEFISWQTTVVYFYCLEIVA